MNGEFVKIFEERLSEALSEKNVGGTYPLSDAMRYACLLGGKRLRPQCVKLGAEFAKGGNLSDEEISLVADFAVSVELIHSYSLVHDDMPEMDNDEMRRGNLTVHKKFGADMALLCGDALLNLAYERLFRLAAKNPKVIAPAKFLSECAGILGMIKGQCLDLTVNAPDLDGLLKINALKTGRMFTASFVSGAMLQNADEDEISALLEYSQNIGAAFQIIDDLSDADKDKKSTVKICGQSKAALLAQNFIDAANNCLEKFPEKAVPLLQFSEKILNLKNAKIL